MTAAAAAAAAAAVKIYAVNGSDLCHGYYFVFFAVVDGVFFPGCDGDDLGRLWMHVMAISKEVPKK